MALILNIETATTNCSVSLSENTNVLALKEEHSEGYSHAELLHVFINEVFKIATVAPKSIDAIAVSMGPGSYTGLRIGVSAAKGLCFALNKPLIATETLKSLALKIKSTEEAFIIPLLDARRMEVYTAVFSNNYQVIEPTTNLILNHDSFSTYLQQAKVYFIGTGTKKTKELIQHPNAVFMEAQLPSSKEMALISSEKFKSKQFEDLAYFEPFYLKPVMALKMNQKV